MVNLQLCSFQGVYIYLHEWWIGVETFISYGLFPTFTTKNNSIIPGPSSLGQGSTIPLGFFSDSTPCFKVLVTRRSCLMFLGCQKHNGTSPYLPNPKPKIKHYTPTLTKKTTSLKHKNFKQNLTSFLRFLNSKSLKKTKNTSSKKQGTGKNRLHLCIW